MPEGNGEVREKAAARVSVSPRSFEHASAILKQGVPQLAKMVDLEEVAVSAVPEVAEPPRAE
ncbi:MAG TPA: hypothetical protein VKU02_31665 [Gemmataceae bacterium]|nr:hypothetical protein [Gemmataceae bacterium]